MDKDEIILLLNAAIDLELAMAELYSIFETGLPNDRAFWSQLHLEEKNHAALLRAAQDSYSSRDLLPERMIPRSMEHIQSAQIRIARLIEKFRATPPERKAACRLSILLEKEISEEHYNHFMHLNPDSQIESVFQQLNRNDKDHADRISRYLDEIGN